MYTDFFTTDRPKPLGRHGVSQHSTGAWPTLHCLFPVAQLLHTVKKKNKGCFSA
uniref:Uncharacterized protein n=1 Tax=Rhizophora mucronata TaxID=61149 RepID=A0A2P2IY08_RHIMU